MGGRVIIIEASEIIRKGMVHILYESGLFSEVKELSHATNLQDIIKRDRPDVLIINPDLDTGWRRTSEGQVAPGTKIVALDHSGQVESHRHTFDEVITLRDNQVKIQKTLGRLNLTSDESPVHESQLSAREKDVLMLLVRGFSNKEISGQLFISTHTVMSHRKNIVRKLNIRSVAGLTVYAILNGLASMEDLK